jgi:hypothetical protein
MHYCITCGKDLPESKFHLNKHKPSGLQDHCKKHQIQYVDQYYVANSKVILRKCSLRYKLKSGKLDRSTFEKEFTELTGKEPRTNKGYTKRVSKSN